MGTNIQDLANGWLSDAVDGAASEVRKAWDKLKVKEQGIVVAALQDIATLRIREAGGQNITQELPYAKATLQNMKVVVEIVLFNSILNVVEASLKQLGSIIAGLAGGLKGG